MQAVDELGARVGASAKILNVNDEEGQRYVTSRTLSSRGHVVLDAIDGASARELMQRERPELVLLDVRLPDVNGVDLCRDMKRKDPFLAILLMSAYDTTEEDTLRALENGADAYLVLPADPRRLAAVVETVLRIHRLYRAQLTLERHTMQELQGKLNALERANAELRDEIDVLQKFNDVIVGRELKMMELKARIEHLERELATYKHPLP